jgi:hypothetical protein
MSLNPEVPNSSFSKKINGATRPATDRLSESASSPSSAAPITGLRNDLDVHPAAGLFPLMSPDELCALGEDIVKNGLTSPIVLWRASPEGQLQLLDGRNRLDAIELITGKPVEVGAPSLMAGEFLATDKVIVLDHRVDPWAYTISANIHRRHLTTEQKRELIAKLLKATPEKSNRQIAETVKASPTTVGTVRAEMESTVQIGQLPKRIGKDGKGRKQPAQKRTAPAKPKRSTSQDRRELAVKQAHIDELEAAREHDKDLAERLHLAEIKIVGLESEIEELKAENAELRAKLEAAQGAAAASPKIATADTVTTGDPGPIPDCLRRKPEATSVSVAALSQGRKP